MSEDGKVDLAVYDVFGRTVEQLVNKRQQEGRIRKTNKLNLKHFRNKYLKLLGNPNHLVILTFCLVLVFVVLYFAVWSFIQDLEHNNNNPEKNRFVLAIANEAIYSYTILDYTNGKIRINGFKINYRDTVYVKKYTINSDCIFDYGASMFFMPPVYDENKKYNIVYLNNERL